MSRCYLSRMDVIGFSNIYNADPQKINNILGPIIRDLNSELSRYNLATGIENGLVFHKMYGDTIDIWFEAGNNDKVRFLALVDITCMVQRKLMGEGLMVRGAIVCDDLIDTELAFTGMAMVQAAKLEKGMDSPHLRFADDALEMLERSAEILFANEKDREAYIDSTVYEEDKLDCLRHPPYVIPYEMGITEESVRACIDKIENISLCNAPDDGSLDKANQMLDGLKRYCWECFCHRRGRGQRRMRVSLDLSLCQFNDHIFRKVSPALIRSRRCRILSRLSLSFRMRASLTLSVPLEINVMSCSSRLRNHVPDENIASHDNT